jgi:hypothetical protein
MPKLISESEIKLDWADINSRVPKRRISTTRSPGIHLSGVLQYAARTAGILTREDEEDGMPVRMAVGMAWEEWAVGLWPNLEWQPGECRRDQVFGNPDGRTKTTISYQLDEFKATWKSLAKYGDILAPLNRLWIWQLAGYCVMMKLTYARLHVMWICGDYRPPNPTYRTYLLQFTKQELEEFWRNVVMANKDQVEPEVARARD